MLEEKVFFVAIFSAEHSGPSGRGPNGWCRTRRNSARRFYRPPEETRDRQSGFEPLENPDQDFGQLVDGDWGFCSSSCGARQQVWLKKF